MPGTAAGTWRRKHRSVAAATSSTEACRWQALPGTTIFGLSSMPSRSDTLLEERVEDRMEHRTGHLLATFDGMGPVHEHFRLHDRHNALLLAQRRIPGQGMGVGADTHGAGNESVMRITARHLANRAPMAAYSFSRSRSPSSPSVTVSSGDPASVLAPLSTLIPGMIPCSTAPRAAAYRRRSSAGWFRPAGSRR